jgi:hypothetical protein
VLELACGTGQLAVPIASAGLPTVGLEQELPLLVSARGVELIERFGNLSREPFGSGSPQQVCLCRAAA